VDLALLVERPPHANTITLQGPKCAALGSLHSPPSSPTTTSPGPRTRHGEIFGLEVEDQTSDRAIETGVLEALAALPV
jgi:hypothetical protein